MRWNLWGAVLGLALVALFAVNAKDVYRYLRISSM